MAIKRVSGPDKAALVKRYTDYNEFKKDFNYNDPNYAFYYKFIKRPISYPLTWLIYGKTSFTPNQLTFIGFAFALFSALSFSFGSYRSGVFGALFFFIFEIFDDFDGIVARAKNLRSKRGAWLDIILGVAGKVIVLVGISWGVFHLGGNSFYLLLGLLALAGFSLVTLIDFSIKFCFSDRSYRKLRFEEHKPNARTLKGQLSIWSEAAMNLWYALMLVCGLSGILEVFLIYSAIYYPSYAVMQFLYRNLQYRDY